MDRRIDLFQILRQEDKLQTLLCYSAKETVNDPYEQTKTKIYQNPLPVKGVVRQLSQESLRWKYYGKIPSLSIEVLTELKYESLFKTADKIEWSGKFYHTMKDDSQNFIITKRDDYLVVILGINNQ